MIIDANDFAAYAIAGAPLLVLTEATEQEVDDVSTPAERTVFVLADRSRTIRVAKRKDPDARLDWKIDWSDYLQDGETIVSSLWAIDASADALLVIGSGTYAPTETDTTATVWLTGGSLHKTYYVRNRITTSSGRIDDESIRIFVIAM